MQQICEYVIRNKKYILELSKTQVRETCTKVADEGNQTDLEEKKSFITRK